MSGIKPKIIHGKKIRVSEEVYADLYAIKKYAGLGSFNDLIKQSITDIAKRARKIKECSTIPWDMNARPATE